MWHRSCLRRSLRRAVTRSLTPKAERTASVKRAEKEGGCEEVGCVFNEILYGNTNDHVGSLIDDNTPHSTLSQEQCCLAVVSIGYFALL